MKLSLSGAVYSQQEYDPREEIEAWDSQGKNKHQVEQDSIFADCKTRARASRLCIHDSSPIEANGSRGVFTYGG